MSDTPPPSEADPEDGFRDTPGGEATEPAPGADEPTLVVGEPIAETDEPTLENALVQAGDEPVFVDASGRRRTLLRRVGIGIGALAAAYMALLVVSLAGGPRPPWVPLPEAIAGDPGQTQTEPDGVEPRTPVTRSSEPTGSSPTATAGPGSEGAPASPSAGPTPPAVPPDAAVPPVPPQTAVPGSPTTPASPATTPASPTTPGSATPSSASPGPGVTIPTPAEGPTEVAQP
jgi:hypothetical protein